MAGPKAKGGKSGNASDGASKGSNLTYGAVQELLSNYDQKTPRKLKIVDAYLVFVLLTGILVFVYCVVFGSFPMNAFLAAFISTACSFVLAASLRMQCDASNNDFSGISPQRAFADYVFCAIILHLVVVNFLG